MGNLHLNSSCHTMNQATTWIKYSPEAETKLLSVLQNNPQKEYFSSDRDKSQRKHWHNWCKMLSYNKVWGGADGLKEVLLQKSSDLAMQNLFNNGWTANTFINIVFVSTPDGRIQICTINAPGSWQNSTMVEYGVYDNMEVIFLSTVDQWCWTWHSSVKTKSFSSKVHQIIQTTLRNFCWIAMQHCSISYCNGEWEWSKGSPGWKKIYVSGL